MLTLSIRRRKTLRPDVTQEGELEHQTTVPCGITSVPMHLGQQEPHACIACMSSNIQHCMVLYDSVTTDALELGGSGQT